MFPLYKMEMSDFIRKFEFEMILWKNKTYFERFVSNLLFSWHKNLVKWRIQLIYVISQNKLHFSFAPTLTLMQHS